MPAADENMHIYLISLQKTVGIENKKQVAAMLTSIGESGIRFYNCQKSTGSSVFGLAWVFLFFFFFLCCSFQLEHL